jgi:Zn-dependent protease with chaperone function
MSGSLKPLADSISKVAQSRYPHPFKFFIVHEPHPNAFATPGGKSMSWRGYRTSKALAWIIKLESDA